MHDHSHDFEKTETKKINGQQKIAVIGSGISGLTAAHYLNKHHQVTLFEAEERLGGHTATKKIIVNGKDYAIDTGFIVFNDWTYPNFIRLLNELGVESQPTQMGFSVYDTRTQFEYAGNNFFSLFAQKRNLFSVSHWRMLFDIVRFNRESIEDLTSGEVNAAQSLDDYLQKNKYSAAFRDRYLIPMGSAIWSTTQEDMLKFPLKFFVQFFKNHGLLSVNHRPVWRVVKGGSSSYIKPLIKAFSGEVHLNSPVTGIKRSASGVTVAYFDKAKLQNLEQHFDQVVIACHSNQALKLLQDVSDQEKKCLADIPYQENSVILHTDARLMPQRKISWSSWNYQLDNTQDAPPILTYSMNILQSIQSDVEFFVTLNAKDKIDPKKILGEYQYAHPIFNHTSVDAQKRWHDINGINRTWFCGAYWFNGFHEDGVNSGLRVARALGVDC